MASKLITYFPYRPGSSKLETLELTAEFDGDELRIPELLAEDGEGVIIDLCSSRNWRSLPEMTNDLRVEIKSWGSEVGD